MEYWRAKKLARRLRDLKTESNEVVARRRFALTCEKLGIEFQAGLEEAVWYTVCRTLFKGKKR